jgi:hypothetical protein
MRASLARRRARLDSRLTVDDEVVVYCPECEAAEFGE